MISFVGKKPHFEWYINENSYSTIFHFFNRGEKLIQIENLHDFPMMPNWGYLIENVSILLLRQSVLRLQKQTYIDSAQQFYFRFTHKRASGTNVNIHPTDRPTIHPSCWSRTLQNIDNSQVIPFQSVWILVWIL